MQRGSGLKREQLTEARKIAYLSVIEGRSGDPGVREEQFLQALIGNLPTEQAERALYAFRKSILPAEQRGIPVGRIAVEAE